MEESAPRLPVLFFSEVLLGVADLSLLAGLLLFLHGLPSWSPDGGLAGALFLGLGAGLALLRILLRSSSSSLVAGDLILLSSQFILFANGSSL
jgi:hypothetical protein